MQAQMSTLDGLAKKSFSPHFRHSRESGNPVNSNTSGLLLSQE
jgi:hypothetical protein